MTQLLWQYKNNYLLDLLMDCSPFWLSFLLIDAKRGVSPGSLNNNMFHDTALLPQVQLKLQLCSSGHDYRYCEPVAVHRHLLCRPSSESGRTKQRHRTQRDYHLFLIMTVQASFINKGHSVPLGTLPGG